MQRIDFMIKHECYFKYEESECFILELVEHDRVEILKKGIGMFELQWYGFYMFKALEGLHIGRVLCISMSKQILNCLFKYRLEWMKMKCENRDPKTWLLLCKETTLMIRAIFFRFLCNVL
ncbi:uncharacterized protein LOC114578565 [Dendrobium catenatum]|uniref:uncharacterized protein LOC114578565 n=1 Tax=Dendrobium catenatum TaxID=906689 RepID=UPI00109EE953|nr:uncharacterized protein LOC114578565 [Dendrobium catenatum]